MLPMKATKIYSVLTCTCPRCHEGPIFYNSNPYKLSNWDKMHVNCEVCGLKFEREPGFFQGAMYVSYAFGVALSVSVLILYYIIAGWNPFGYFIANAAALVVFAPFLFRYSRSVYMNFFTKYDPKSGLRAE